MIDFPSQGHFLQVDRGCYRIDIERAGSHQVADEWQGAQLVHANFGVYYCEQPGMQAIAEDGEVFPFAGPGLTLIPPWFSYRYQFQPHMGHAYIHAHVTPWTRRLVQELWPRPQ